MRTHTARGNHRHTVGAACNRGIVVLQVRYVCTGNRTPAASLESRKQGTMSSERIPMGSERLVAAPQQKAHTGWRSLSPTSVNVRALPTHRRRARAFLFCVFVVVLQSRTGGLKLRQVRCPATSLSFITSCGHHTQSSPGSSVGMGKKG